MRRAVIAELSTAAARELDAGGLYSAHSCLSSIATSHAHAAAEVHGIVAPEPYLEAQMLEKITSQTDRFYQADMCVGICVGMQAGMCAGMRAGMCAGVCADCKQHIMFCNNTG